MKKMHFEMYSDEVLKAMDSPAFEALALHNVAYIATVFTKAAETAWDATDWAFIWGNAEGALAGAGFDVPAFDEFNILNLDMLRQAYNEAWILQRRKQSGRCLCCGDALYAASHEPVATIPPDSSPELEALREQAHKLHPTMPRRRKGNDEQNQDA